jgi:molybdopterin-synthase adenylyltransferase
MNEDENEVFLSRPLTDGDRGNTYEIEDYVALLFKMISKGNYTEEFIINEISNKYPGSYNEINDTLKFLSENKYITHIENDSELLMNDDLKKYDRILPLWSEFETQTTSRFDIQNNLMSKKVGIIGCGTIGSEIVSQLVAYGVNDFILMDNDVVDRTNLTRQTLFSLRDINQPKVSVLKDFIESRIENSSVFISKKLFSTEEDLTIFKDVDILVFAADMSNLQKIQSNDIITPENIMENFSCKHNIPIFITGGYKGHTGRVFPITIPNKTHSLSCLIDNLLLKNKNLKNDFTIDLNKNSNISLSSTSEMSTIVGSIISFEIIKFLSDIIPVMLFNKVLYIEFQNYTVGQIVVPEENFKCSCMLQLVDNGLKLN